MLYLGIDSGTQSTKCIVLDTSTWQIVASAQAWPKLATVGKRGGASA